MTQVLNGIFPIVPMPLYHGATLRVGEPGIRGFFRYVAAHKLRALISLGREAIVGPFDGEKSITLITCENKLCGLMASKALMAEGSMITRAAPHSDRLAAPNVAGANRPHCGSGATATHAPAPVLRSDARTSAAQADPTAFWETFSGSDLRALTALT